MEAKELIEMNPLFCMVTGEAGSGKTYLIREVIKQKPDWGLLCATTGTAARVLGEDVKTYNSSCGFFDLESLQASISRGTLSKNLKTIRKKYRRLIIDEASMIDAQVFELLVQQCQHAGLGLILVGDFLQLPPVQTWNKGKTYWLFKTNTWAQFDVLQLTSQWRHTNPSFLKALNLLRSGKGAEAIAHLKSAGVIFKPTGTADPHFNGTTIVATNSKRAMINKRCYDELDGEEYTYTTTRSGKQLYEWKEIAEQVTLRCNARVMILRNLYDKDTHELLQANGDTGLIIEMGEKSVTILRDDGETIEVEMFLSHNARTHSLIHSDGSREVIVDEEPSASIKYMPLTLAWALTTHKAQGLTIKHPCQIIFEDFFQSAAMVYVAISRVANPCHLTLVGAGDTGIDYETKQEVQIFDEPRIKTFCNMDKQCEAFV